MIETAHTEATEQKAPEALAISEYGSLRSEIAKRVELRQQVLLALLSIAGVFFSIGVQPGISGLTVLVYPIIALFLAAAWTHNDLRIGQITLYLRTRVEQRYMGEEGGWETYRHSTFKSEGKQRADKMHPLAASAGKLALSTRGLFLTTQGLAIAIGAARTFPMLLHPDTLPLVALLLAAALLSTILTVPTLQHRRS